MSQEDEIRKLFEELDPKGDLPIGRIEDFISAVKDMELNPLKDGDKIGDMYFSILQQEKELKKQIINEQDWKIRAIIAARIISLNLE